MWKQCSSEMPPKSIEFTWCTVAVLVSDGENVGIGHYNYNCKWWVYKMVGKLETSDNKITQWELLPSPLSGPELWRGLSLDEPETPRCKHHVLSEQDGSTQYECLNCGLGFETL
jgi:hypothetical protein